MRPSRIQKATGRNFLKTAAKKDKKWFNRLNLLVLMFFLFVFLIIARLFSLQVLEHSFYTALAEGQHAIYQKIFPERGEILVQDHYSDKLYPIATNIDLNLVYAVPKQITDPENTSKVIASILELPEEEVLARLSKKDDLYEPLKHYVSDEIWEQIKSMNLAGIKATKEKNRLYPEAEITSHITGFIGYQNDERVGQYGLEGYFNEALAGQQGFLNAEQDAAGRWITIGKKMLIEAKNGDDLILTVDHTVQYYACTKLKEAVEKHGGDEGTVIIMNPKTGAIISMCNVPIFDANEYAEVKNIEVFINSAISDQYEPGSVFKSITMATALNLGKVTPASTYEDKGEIRIGSYTIRNSDYKTHGIKTMTNVLEESLNLGAIYAVQQVGNENYYHYVEKFGFGQKTGIELEGESSGDISTLSLNKDIYAATASYGQGITITPLQLVTAYAAIANDGKLMRPYLVDTIVKQNGFETKTQPEVKAQVISPEAARTLSAMLVSVVNKGHAKRAQVAGYFVAGKTGTAQIARKDGVGYESGRHNDTFVSFAPVDHPAFVVLAKINDPKDVEWAEGSVVPLVGEINKFLLDYYQIPPDDTE